MNRINLTPSATSAQVNLREREKLLPASVRQQLPLLGTTDGHANPVAYAKFFTPDGEETFFGLVDGLSRELGYFYFDEILSVRGRLGLPVERDLYFELTPLSELP